MRLLLFFVPVYLGFSVESDTTLYDTTDVVKYGGKNLIYLVSEERLILLDSAWVSYRDLMVRSDSIEYNTKTKILSAFKDVTFLTSAESIIGKALHYNINTRKGMMRQARSKVGDGFIACEECWLVKEKTLNLNQGYYTTCDLPNPHYDFYGTRVKIFMDDMAITQPILLKIRKVPVATAPFWFVPVGKKRKSGLSPFRVGSSRDWGYYARGISYYLVLNDYADLTFGLDIMNKKGFQPKLEGIYIIDPFARGQFLLTYIKELKGQTRYSLNSRHSSIFLWDSEIDGYIDYQNDARYIPDYAEDRVDWLKTELRSYLNLSRSFRKVGRSALTFEHYHRFETKYTELKLPAFALNFYERPILPGVNYSPGISFGNSLTKLGDSLKTTARSMGFRQGVTFVNLPLYTTQGVSYQEKMEYNKGTLTTQTKNLSGNANLSSSQNLLSTLFLSEGFSFSENISLKDTITYQSRYNFNLSSNITLYRIFGIYLGPLKGVLHRVTPSIGFNYEPQVSQVGFFGKPRFDTLPKTAGLGFGLANSFLGKFVVPLPSPKVAAPSKQEFVEEETILEPEKREETKVKKDLCYINFGSSYDLVSKQLSPLTSYIDIPVIDFRGMRFNTNFTLSYKLSDTTSYLSKKRFIGYSFNSTLTFSLSFFRDTVRKTEYSLSANLTHFIDPTANMLLANFNFTPPGFNIAVGTGYNFKDKRLASFNINLIKDLHCWELLLNTQGLGRNIAYDFKFRIKKIPDVSIGKGIFSFLLP